MTVYFIQGESRFGPVKIGHSHDPETRLGQLQVSHWETLRIIRLFKGAEADEAALHLRFFDLHIRGEWHSFSRAMMGEVGLVEILPAVDSGAQGRTAISAAPVDAETFGCALKGLRSRRGWTQMGTARALGVSRSTIASIEAGHDLPGRDLLSAISLLFKVPLDLSTSLAPAAA